MLQAHQGKRHDPQHESWLCIGVKMLALQHSMNAGGRQKVKRRAKYRQLPAKEQVDIL